MYVCNVHHPYYLLSKVYEQLVYKNVIVIT